jgi:NitT/TauT family transport system substrate-binding protein
MNFKKLIALLALVIVAAGASFLLIGNKPQARTEKIRVSQAFQHLLYIALYVAKDGGFFDQEGLDVTISTAGGDAQAFAALTSGQSDFAQGDPAFIAIASEQGWEGRVVAMAVDRVAIWGITFKADIERFSNPEGFRNKRVATYPYPNTSYVVQAQLAKRAGLTLGVDTEIVQVQFGSEIAAAKEGRVDIAQTIEPNATQVEGQGGKIVFSYPEAWGPLAFTGVMTSRKLIEDHPTRVQRFVNAYEKALQYVHKERAGTIAIAKKWLPDLDEKVVGSALDRLIKSGSIPFHTRIDPVSWEKLLQVRIEVGDLKAVPTKSLYDNAFADQASK